MREGEPWCWCLPPFPDPMLGYKSVDFIPTLKREEQSKKSPVKEHSFPWLLCCSRRIREREGKGTNLYTSRSCSYLLHLPLSTFCLFPYLPNSLVPSPSCPVHPITRLPNQITCGPLCSHLQQWTADITTICDGSSMATGTLHMPLYSHM